MLYELLYVIHDTDGTTMPVYENPVYQDLAQKPLALILRPLESAARNALNDADRTSGLHLGAQAIAVVIGYAASKGTPVKIVPDLAS